MIQEAICGCASLEKCCPHSLEDKFEYYIEDLEVIVDKTLRKFSRSELLEFLDEVSPHQSLFKAKVPLDPYLDPLFDRPSRKKGKQTKLNKTLTSKDDSAVFPHFLQEHQKMGEVSKSARPRTTDNREPRSRQLARTKRDFNAGPIKNSIQAISQAYSPRGNYFPVEEKANLDNKYTKNKVRNMLEVTIPPSSDNAWAPKSLPSLKKVSKLPSENNRAAASHKKLLRSRSEKVMSSSAQSSLAVDNAEVSSLEDVDAGNRGFDDTLPGMSGIWKVHGGYNLVDELPKSNAIPVCLHHIVELFVRRILPWQGYLCRRAIESVRTLRSKKMNAVYDEYIEGMCERLRNKVGGFMDRKMEECKVWAQGEAESWEKIKSKLRGDLSQFVGEEISRQKERRRHQLKLQQQRDMAFADGIELSEKSKMDEQLHDVLNLCHGASEKMDTRAMNVTIGAAAVRASVQSTVIKRGILKKKEAAHEWLRCIADNSITVEILESGVTRFRKNFQREKNRSYKRLTQTKKRLKEQYVSMIGIIDNFCSDVFNQVIDHTTRERLVSFAFSDYLADLSSGHLKKKGGLLLDTLSTEERDFETENTRKRAERNCKQTLFNRAQNLSALETVKSELIDQVTNSFEEVANNVLGEPFMHRDADVEQYMTDVARVLGKVTQISCNTRRKALNESNVKRANFFRFEDECVVEMGSLLASIRFEMDETWRKEHLLGVKINLAAQSRLEDEIMSSEDNLKLAYNELSCFLEGERSNVHWVDVAAEDMEEKNDLMLEKMHNLRMASHYKWVLTIRKALPIVSSTVDNVTKAFNNVNDESSDGYPVELIDFESKEFQRFFDKVTENCELASYMLRCEHDNRSTQEANTITSVFGEIREHVDKVWRANVSKMNDTLTSEVKIFLDKHDEFMSHLSEYNILNEIEMYVFEQASSHRLDMFWKEIYDRNKVFADELSFTLKRIIREVEKEQIELMKNNNIRKIDASMADIDEEDILKLPSRMKIELGGEGSPEKSDLKAKLSSSFRQNYSAIASATPQTFNVARNLQRMSLANTLQNENIDMENHVFVFDAIESPDAEVHGDGRRNGSSLRMRDFATVNDALKSLISSIPVSRIRNYVNRVDNEFQSIQVKDQPVSFSESFPLLNSYLRIDNLSDEAKCDDPDLAFDVPVGRALKCLRTCMAGFIENSKLIEECIELLEVKCILSNIDTTIGSHTETVQSSEDLLCRDKDIFARLVDIFSLSASILTISQVMQYQQSVASRSIVEYLGSNIRDVCLASCYVLITVLSTMKIPVDSFGLPLSDMNRDSPYYSFEVTHSLPFLRSGLQEMLQTESDWMLTCLEIDTPEFDLLNSTGFDSFDMNDAYNDCHGPQRITSHSTTSADLTLYFKKFCEWVPKSSDDLTSIHLGYVKSAKAISKRLLSIGVSEADICVLISLLVTETKHSVDQCIEREGDMVNVTADMLEVSIKIWRLVSFCKLQALAQCSFDKIVVSDSEEEGQTSKSRYHFQNVEDVLSKCDVLSSKLKEEFDSGNIRANSISPFETVGKFIYGVANIPEIPLSYIQGMSFLSTNGSFLCDPWVLEPTLSTNSSSFYLSLSLQVVDFIRFFILEGYLLRSQSQNLIKNAIPSHKLSPQFMEDALEQIKILCQGINRDQVFVPIEVLRSYCSNETELTRSCEVEKEFNELVEFTNTQITLRFWTAYRLEGIDGSHDKRDVESSTKSIMHVNHKSTVNQNSLKCAERSQNNATTDCDGDTSTASVSGETIEKSVVDLLDIESSVGSFTNLLKFVADGNISSENRFSDAIGISTDSSRVFETSFIHKALSFESQLHHPIQSSICVWNFSHLRPFSLDEINDILHKRYNPVVSNATSLTSSSCPSYFEIRKRIELGVLMQFTSNTIKADCNNDNEQVIMACGELANDSSAVAKYWRYLSSNRISRTGKFTSVLKSVMLNHWSEILQKQRKSRYLARSEAQLSLFKMFKEYISAYREESLRQREVLKGLYEQVSERINEREATQLHISDEYLSIMDHITSLFVTSLKVTLEKYRSAKVSYLSLNKTIYLQRLKQIERVRARCRKTLEEAASNAHGSFMENCVSPQLQRVSESIEIGERKYDTIERQVSQCQSTFLAETSSDFSKLLATVKKKLNDFEYEMKSAIYEVNEMEKLINKTTRHDQSNMLYELKSYLHDFSSDQVRGIKPFFERYKEVESIVVSYMLESYCSFKKKSNGEEESVLSSVDTDKKDTSLTIDGGKKLYEHSKKQSEEKDMVASDSKDETHNIENDKNVSDNAPLPISDQQGEKRLECDVSSIGSLENSIRVDDKQDVRDEEGNLILPPDKCGLSYLTNLHSAISKYTVRSKSILMNKIREEYLSKFSEAAKIRVEALYQKVQSIIDKIQQQWNDLHGELRQMLSSYISDACVKHSNVSIELWNLASSFRLVEFERLASLNEASVWGFKKIRRPELRRSDNKDLKIFERFSRESQNVIISAEVDLAPGHEEVMPPELSAFLTQVNSSSSNLMSEFLPRVEDLYRKTHSDEMFYNCVTTIEQFAGSLDGARKQLVSIVDDYENDKVNTISVLKYNSNVRREVGASIQVESLLDVMVETVVARDMMYKNLSSQLSVTDTRSKSLEKNVCHFLAKNSLNECHMENGTMDEKFVDQVALGVNDSVICKLKSKDNEKHGICVKCTAELFYTVKRNNAAYKSKIESLRDTLRSFYSNEELIEIKLTKNLNTLLKRACLEAENLENGVRNEIISSLELAFRHRFETGRTNSVVNEPAESIDAKNQGPFVRDNDEILQELIAAVKKPPRREGVAIEYPEYSDNESDITTPTIQSGEAPLHIETLNDVSQFSVEDVYFNGIFQRTQNLNDGLEALHGDKTVGLPANSMEFSPIKRIEREENEIEEFLRKHEELTLHEQEMEQLALEEEKRSIEEAQLVASYNETQEALEAERLREEEKRLKEIADREAEHEAIRAEAYAKAQREFFEMYPDKDPNIYSYSNKFDSQTLTFKSTKTMVNPDTYEAVSDDYKDEALQKLLGIGGKPNKKHPLDTYVPPPEVPSLPLASVLARYTDLKVQIPYGWEEKGHDEQGEIVYYNKLTGETSIGLHPCEYIGHNWRLCYTDEGVEYYYNDETGHSTWRRPRVTLSNQKLTSNEVAVDEDATDEHQDAFVDAQYSPSYQETDVWSHDASIRPNGEDSTFSAYQEFDNVSEGDRSAFTDDSKNNCFRVGQFNCDEDIYKFYLSPRGSRPQTQVPKENVEKKSELKSYPDFRDKFKMSRLSSQSFRIEGNLTSFGSKKNLLQDNDDPPPFEDSSRSGSNGSYVESIRRQFDERSDDKSKSSKVSKASMIENGANDSLVASVDQSIASSAVDNEREDDSSSGDQSENSSDYADTSQSQSQSEDQSSIIDSAVSSARVSSVAGTSASVQFINRTEDDPVNVEEFQEGLDFTKFVISETAMESRDRSDGKESVRVKDDADEPEDFSPFQNVPQAKAPLSPNSGLQHEQSAAGEDWTDTYEDFNNGDNEQWTEHFTELGEKYFYNTLTGESTWAYPENDPNYHYDDSINYDRAVNVEEDPWVPEYTQDGMAYYVHRTTGESRWDHPDFPHDHTEIFQDSSNAEDTNNLNTTTEENENADDSLRSAPDNAEHNTTPLVARNKSRKNVLEANRETDKSLETQSPVAQRVADQAKLIRQARLRKKPEDSLLSHYPLFASSVDSLPSNNPSFSSNISGGDGSAYGMIDLPSFKGGSLMGRNKKAIKKSKSFKKEKKANIAKQV